MTPAPVPLQSLCLLCVFAGVCVQSAAGSLPHTLPWHVPCPLRCACQIKPWFSSESVYHDAPTVDCNDLLLTSLPSPVPPNTHTLRLQSNLLSELDSAVLRGLPNLTDLDLSQNRFSSVWAIREGPSLSSLLSLHLEENHLSHLPEASFSSLPALQELFLSHNNLYSIAPGAFAGLDSLLRLHINNNRIKTINPQWFKALPQLQVLMLGENPVETLPERGFKALRALRSLVLGGMGLRGLAEDALEGLDVLESLSFYDNLLAKVPMQALRRVPALKFLDLNKNRIRLVDTGDFRDMVHLKELGLNNMDELVSIERGALQNLPELTKLEITNNPRLSYVHPQAFLRLRRLESLMLNSNSLSALHEQVLASLPNLQEVSLHSNPLRCDCIFQWAADGSVSVDVNPRRDKRPTRAVRFIQPQTTLCAEPPELRGRKVREVSSREMSAFCLPMIPAGSLPSYVGVREGRNLSLHCRALAVPEPRLYWVTPSGLRLGPAPGQGANLSSSSTAPTSHHSREFPSSSAPSVVRDATPDGLEGPRGSKRYRLLPEGTLEIEAVTANDGGLYTCIAENTLGADTRSVTVGVRGRERKRKRGGEAILKAVATLEVREVGERYAILSWKSRRNVPSTRLSWQAIHPNVHAPTYTTRILAGTQSFNLTHLHAKTFYQVCLHLRSGEGAKRAGRHAREVREPRCVSFRTKETAKPPPGLRLSPELTSTVLTLSVLALLLLVLAGQGWEPEPCEGKGKLHSALLQEIKRYKAELKNSKAGGVCQHQQRPSEKLLLHQDC